MDINRVIDIIRTLKEDAPTMSMGAGGIAGTLSPITPGGAGGDSKFGYVVAYGGGGGGTEGSSFIQYDPLYRSNQNYGSSGGVVQAPGGFKVVMGSHPLGAEYITRLGDYGGPRTIDDNNTNSSTESYALNHGFISGRKITPHGFIATGAGNHGDNAVAGGGGGAGGHPGYSQLNRLGGRSDYLGSMQGTTGWYGRGGRGLPGSAIGYPTLEFAGGGGGGGSNYQPGNAGGGNGTYQTAGGDALANSGSGGGGCSGGGNTAYVRGGNGGSGVCIIRYPTSYNAATGIGTAATDSQSGYHVYRWNTPGSITFNP